MSLSARLVAVSSLTVLLAGCGMTGTNVSPGSTPGHGFAVNGTVHGGQQPVVGAQIALYAAGKTGVASAPRSMLTAPVQTDSAGNFNISGLYSCQPGDQVYLVATGGDAGSGANGAISLMTALGSCANLVANASTTFITVNEATTVASVYALAGFMNGVQALGSGASAASMNALAAAFANVQTLVNTATGFAPTATTGNGIVPQTTINSLANSLAACVNSTAAGTACSNLFSYSSAGGSTPADTLQAAVNIAHFPATNAAQIFGLASASPPFLPTLTAAPASYSIAVAHPSDVLTYHNDNSRTGAQTYEATLTPANVNVATFGKKFTFAVDSYLFAQPLYVGGYGMPDGAVHNLVFAATTHGTVYAFDADGNNPAGGAMWSVSLVPGGERYAQASDYGCSNPPEAGIVGTPVIDRASGTMYLVTKTVATVGGVTHQRLHALSLIDGSEQPNSPQDIAPVFAGTGAGSAGGTIPFSSLHQLNRAALTLTTSATGAKTVWVAFASHCDIGPYHGVILGYDATNPASIVATFNDTPNGSDGGIWLGAGGLSADGTGSIYALAGNGNFDANTGGPDYGDSALRLLPPANPSAATAMTVADSFTPTNQAYLSSTDRDFGGTEAILFDDPASGVAPNLLVGSDKNGTIYLLNRGSLGGYNTGAGGTNGDLAEIRGQGGNIYNFAFFNNVLYTSTPVTAFSFVRGTASTAGTLDVNALGRTGISFSAPVVSANGTGNVVVWTEDQSGVLHAFTALNLTEIYNSTQAAGGRDAAAPFVKFTSPVIANGKVYLSGQNALVVYGPLP